MLDDQRCAGAGLGDGIRHLERQQRLIGDDQFSTAARLRPARPPPPRRTAPRPGCPCRQGTHGPRTSSGWAPSGQAAAQPIFGRHELTVARLASPAGSWFIAWPRRAGAWARVACHRGEVSLITQTRRRLRDQAWQHVRAGRHLPRGPRRGSRRSVTFAGADAVILGAPYDGGTSHRPGPGSGRRRSGYRLPAPRRRRPHLALGVDPSPSSAWSTSATSRCRRRDREVDGPPGGGPCKWRASPGRCR